MCALYLQDKARSGRRPHGPRSLEIEAWKEETIHVREMEYH